MPFKIRVADSAGFCFGVRKALDKLIEIRNQTVDPVRTLGPLIHNEQVLEALEKRAVHELADDEEIKGKHVVLRAHGVTPEKRKQLQEQNAIVCDATCPKVGQVQAIVKKFSRKGCPVIIIGDRGHAEVDGLLGYSGEKGIVVTGPQEASALQWGPEVCVVAQTTQDPLVFSQTVDIIRRKFAICHEFNTICDATSERQRETHALAVESDIMIVVGGKHSANTRRLAEIAGKHCKTIMIQTVEDIDASWFVGVHRVGITAGASTPAWVIGNVVERIRVLGWEQTGPVIAGGFNLLCEFVRHPVTWALGIGLICFSAMYSITGHPPWIIAITVACLTGLWRTFGKRLNPAIDMVFIGLLTLLSITPVILDPKYSTGHILSVGFFIASTYFSRLLLFDCLHVQADRISGLPTLPALIRDAASTALSWLSIGMGAITVASMIAATRSPSVAALIIIPAGFAVFQKKRLAKSGWCVLCDNLYLNLPGWIASILSITLKLFFPG
ncbi:4-hydroxy-3-methylbut-2-enyl diphosphate reductase [bacterium]|nr:4-hydroxy-3-methylbut-2-enyl diphosphate reductase [candidate division CSSED10-310 bacterium]